MEVLTMESANVENIITNIDINSLILFSIILYWIGKMVYNILTGKEKTDNYIDSRVSKGQKEIRKDIENVNKRLTEIEKMELPVQLAKIQTTLALLSDNMKDGFNRIEKRLNK